MSNEIRSRTPVRRALLSVSDKQGIVELARALADRGVDLLSTGGTAKLLAAAGLQVTEVSAHTGFPEIMDGRVKTLHPKIHGGLLGRRGQDDAVMAEHAIAPIDLLVVNLYPFASTIARAGSTYEEGVENIDIGGPAMLRAAAKNHEHVTVVVDPVHYPELLTALDAGGTDFAFRQRLAAETYAHTARYDTMVADWMQRACDGALIHPLRWNCVTQRSWNCATARTPISAARSTSMRWAAQTSAPAVRFRARNCRTTILPMRIPLLSACASSTSRHA